jgi:leader peptidase (prepilin peptidase)/N-methyltransferase
MPSAEQIILTIWFFVIGGVIGSFLNVVVYRVPLGLSLIHPSSHCPNCKHRIRWHDNVPVFGWLWLRGKCRDCAEPISFRYPAVELVCSLMFGILMAVEFTLQGMNLPQREIVSEVENLPSMADNPALYLIAVYHMALLCVLLCGALIEYDRQRPPVRMYVWTIVLGLIFPLQWTILRPMKAWPSEPTLFAGGIEGLLGLAAGGALGYLAARLQGVKQPGGMYLGLACVGVFLGWQPVLPLAIVAAFLGFFTGKKLPEKRQAWRIPASFWLWLLTFFWIVFWAPLVRLLNLP